MIKKLIPDYYYNSIDDIPFTKLYDENNKSEESFEEYYGDNEDENEQKYGRAN